MPTRMNADDLFSGLLAALSRTGITTLSIRADRLDSAVEAVYEALTARADSLGLKLRFHIHPDPRHGGSQTVQDALASAAQRDLVSFDNPEYMNVRLKSTALEDSVRLEQLPGGAALYEELAGVFVQHYEPRRADATA